LKFCETKRILIKMYILINYKIEIILNGITLYFIKNVRFICHRIQKNVDID